MGQEHRLRIGPLLQALLVALDVVGLLLLDRVALGHLDRRPEHVFQAEAPVLGQHHHQTPGRAWRHRCQRPILGRVGQSLRTEEVGGGSGRRHTEGVHTGDLAGLRVEHERLGLAAPAQRVPHRGGGPEHGAGGVHGVAALLEHQRAGRGRERLAGDRDPVAAVQHRLGGALGARPLR